jgi:hypothetical protein
MRKFLLFWGSLVALACATAFATLTLTRKSTARSAQPPAIEDGPERVSIIQSGQFKRSPGTPAPPATQAGQSYVGWTTVDLPQNLPPGPFRATGTLQVNSSKTSTLPQNFLIQVEVSDAATGEMIDVRNFGILETDPSQAYTKTITVDFDFLPGVWVVAFRAYFATQDGSKVMSNVGNAMSASQGITVTVQ